MALIAPNKTFEAEKANASLVKGAVLYALAGLVVALLVSLTSFVTQPGAVGFTMEDAVVIVLLPLVYVVLALVSTAFVHGLCKLMNGDGLYKALFFVNALYAVPFGVLSGLGSVHPLLAIGMSGLLFVCGMYLQYRAVRIVHHLSRVRAAVAVIVPGFIAIVVVLSIVMLVVMAGLLANSVPF